MNTKTILALACGLTLIMTSAFALHTIDRSRRLGEPGLKMTMADVYSEDGSVVSTNTIALPSAVLDFDSASLPITKQELGTLPVDTTYARRLYTASDGLQLQLNVVMMGTDRTSIHRPQLCLTGQGWRILSEQADQIALSGSALSSLPVIKIVAEQQQLLRDGTQRTVRSLYVYWFVADGHVTARHGQRMWWMAERLLTTGTLQRWAYVAAFGQCLPGQEELTYERMKEFIAASVPTYHKFDEHTQFADAELQK